MKQKIKVLSICARGINRSKYLASYLRKKGYSAKNGGVEKPNYGDKKYNPISQEDVDWADIIVIVRKRLIPMFKKKFKYKGKKMIVIDVTDSPKLIPKEFAKLRKLNNKEFNKKYTYPKLRRAIKPYLPFKK